MKIDVTGGTWLSLDVSPDGKEIAFDLLGDEVLDYLRSLEGETLTKAREYVVRASADVCTPIRDAIARELGWLPEQPPAVG